VTDTPFNLRSTFLAVVRALSESGVAYAFIGALPVLAWGRVRATTDIDLVVAAANGWDRVLAALARAGITQNTQIGPADSADSLPDIAVCFSGDAAPVRVDVFVAKTDFERTVVATAREATVFGTTVKLARPEASIIYKLLAYRRRDVDDVESIFAAREAAGEALDWQFLDSWARAWGIMDRLEPYRAKDQ